MANLVLIGYFRVLLFFGAGEGFGAELGQQKVFHSSKLHLFSSPPLIASAAICAHFHDHPRNANLDAVGGYCFQKSNERILLRKTGVFCMFLFVLMFGLVGIIKCHPFFGESNNAHTW